MSNVLEVKNIEKYYGNKSNLTKAIDGISFNVEKGEFVGIMGASGSGKTTLLNCISTIDRVTAGQIIINDQDITKLKGNKLNKFRREELGFIFQDFNLLDTLTAYENIALALTIQKVNPHEIDKKVKDVAEKLDISGILNKYPYQISGGQKQRVASARAIITNPKIVLADEPTGALDSKAARQLLETFEHLNKNLGATILMVTHDAFTASYAERIIFIKDGKIFNELIKGEDTRKQFFEKIIEVSIRNMKKSFKDYAIYFLTLVLGVAIFYMFNSLDSQQAMLEVSQSTRSMIQLLVELLGMLSVFIAIVLGFLIVYANNFLVNRRKREFGIYMTLGMGRRQISAIILLETILVGILSLVVGLFIGIFASQFMSILVAKLFEADMSEFTFVFSKDACIKTCIYFAIMYLAVIVFNTLTISRYKLINLLTAIRKNEKVKIKNPVISIIIFIISAVILGYWNP